MANGTCSVSDCTNEGRLLRGLCRACHQWSWLHGGADPTGRRRTRRQGELAAFVRAAAIATTDECIVLTGYAERPQIVVDGVSMLTSRAVWMHANGDPGDALVLHTCHRGDEGCINIQHLYLGTQADNARDAVDAGHSCRGERHGGASLTAEDVCSIRRRFAAGGVSMTALARQYGVHRVTVHDVIYRRNWAWLDCT